MHKARIDNGIEFAYLDSGAPENSSTYQTLVVVHGHSLHAQHFSKLLPLAPKYDLRIIALNRRDYVGSTLFTSEELDDLLGDNDAKHRQFLQARGLEIARFLVWVIDELKIPPKSITTSSDGVRKSHGGLSLIGWSIGNITTISFLGHLKTYPRDLIEKLEPYFTTLFVGDSHYALFGYPHPEGYYTPLEDPNLYKGMMAIWQGTYFEHPFNDLPLSEQVKPENRTLSTFMLRLPKAHTIRPTTERVPVDDVLAGRDTAPSERSERAFFQTVKISTAYHVFSDAILLDDDADSRSSSEVALPGIKVISIYCAQSYWAPIWGAWQNEADIKKWKAAGRQTRPYELVKVNGANHFFHYDKPDEFLKLISDKLSDK